MIGTYAAWAGFLLAQNASFTFVSRARNSGSYALHACAAVCSNGIWFAAQFISLGLIIEAIKNGTTAEKIGMGAFYTVFTVGGSLAMHWIGINYIEKGKRRVGA
jgi:TRAP-type C4-dicarboxylate transport system permease small subunit